MKVVLIIFFHLLLVSVELNEWKHLALQNLFIFYTFLYLLKGITCNYDYLAFKKYTVYGGLCWNEER